MKKTPHISPAGPADAHVKATREQWLGASIDTLRMEGVDQIRVLPLAQRLGVSRSSFYWYFQSRENLLDEVLAAWSAKNTASIVDHADRSSLTIASGVLGLFECWADSRLFDPKLDAAVRAWASRDVEVEAAVVGADQTRLDAIAGMYARHGYVDSTVRAQVLYYTQIGYYALGIDEPNDVRLVDAAAYVQALTGTDPTSTEVAALAEFLDQVDKSNQYDQCEKGTS